MYKAKCREVKNQILITTTQLRNQLQCGIHQAVRIGNDAGARVQFGKCVRWNRKKIDAYVDSISTH